MIERLLKFLPVKLRRNLEQRRGLTNILNNITWLFFDKFIRLGVGLLVGVWIARYLGPEQFGLFNYALAFVALFGGIASLGLNGVVVRDLIIEHECVPETLGTAFILQLLGGLLALTFVVITTCFVRPDDTRVLCMLIILGFVFIFKSTDVIKYWFESLVQSKYTVWVENGAYIISSVAKIILIVFKASLIYFALMLFVEGVFAAVGLVLIYIFKGGRINAWQFSFKRARSLLNDSWPLLISGTLVLINMSIDKIMLGQLSNDREVGLYSAANTLVGLWYFIPVLIIGSIVPKLIKAYSKNIARYDDLSKRIYRYFGGTAVLISIIFSLFSNPLISFLFGSQYKESGSVLAISIWSIVFVFQVSFRGRLLVIESEQIYITLLIFMGTLTNITLNYLLIPTYGAIGAAISYTAGWAMSATVFPALFRRTRHHAFWSLGLNWNAEIRTRKND